MDLSLIAPETTDKLELPGLEDIPQKDTDKMTSTIKDRPFAVFDIDGTLIRWQLYHAVADALARLGYFDPRVFKGVQEARALWKQRSHDESFKDYEHRLIVAYDQLLTKLTVKQFNEAAESVFKEYKDQAYTYTRDLIKQLKKKNYLLFAISGSQTEIVAKIANYYGFDDFIGSKYERRGNRFTGNKQIAKGTKHLLLQELVKKHQATYSDSIAVGDSEGDVSMLAAVEQPIVFNPNKILFKKAKQRGWPVVVERKNMVYRFEPKSGTYILV